MDCLIDRFSKPWQYFLWTYLAFECVFSLQCSGFGRLFAQGQGSQGCKVGQAGGGVRYTKSFLSIIWRVWLAGMAGGKERQKLPTSLRALHRTEMGDRTGEVVISRPFSAFRVLFLSCVAWHSPFSFFPIPYNPRFPPHFAKPLRGQHF